MLDIESYYFQPNVKTSSLAYNPLLPRRSFAHICAVCMYLFVSDCMDSQAKMDFHDFEHIVFHQYPFHLYFWTFYVIFAVLVTVSWYQWISFLVSCEVQESMIDNVTRYEMFPTRANMTKPSSGCWYYTANTTAVSNTSHVIDRPAYACLVYYSKNGGYG